MKKLFLLIALVASLNCYAIRVKSDAVDTDGSRVMVTNDGDFCKLGNFNLCCIKAQDGSLTWRLHVIAEGAKLEIENGSTLTIEGKTESIVLNLINDVTLDDINSKGEQTLKYDLTEDQIKTIRNSKFKVAKFQTKGKEIISKVDGDFPGDFSDGYLKIKEKF